MKAQATSKFASIDLGTGVPTSVPMETIEVVIDPSILIGDYALAFLKECDRTQPLRAKATGLTVDELFSYCVFLLDTRIKSVVSFVPQYSRFKVLAIPAFIQYCLENVGRVVLNDVGLTMVPTLAETCEVITFEQALVISEKVKSFEDTLVVLTDALPRSPEGNVEVMSTALIAGYVRAQKKVSPVSSYLGAFLGLSLKKENVFQMLYRVQYDDLEYIRMALTSHGGLF